MRLEHPAGALDVDRWRMRLRLHPIDNGCEMNLLFTPQMYETTELAALSREIDAARARERGFVFVDIGANVGLFSMFVAAAAGTGAKIIAVEPESGNFERLLFNIQSNPGIPIRAIPAALSTCAPSSRRPVQPALSPGDVGNARETDIGVELLKQVMQVHRNLRVSHSR